MSNHKSTRQSTIPSSQRIGLFLGPAVFVVLMIVPPPESMQQVARASSETPSVEPVGTPSPKHTTTGSATSAESVATTETERVESRAEAMMAAAAVSAWVACWWITTAVPIPVTSLLPLLLFPVVGVLPIRSAALPYADPNVFLFLGGFIIALGVQRWDLHRRIALNIISVTGTGRATIVLGFMLASAALSMWISNTATTMMMLPIGLSVIAALSPGSDSDRHRSDFAIALMLGIAYAANIGGVATPIGTPPNLVFMGQVARLCPDAPEISFGHWMLLFLPLVVLFVPIVWLILVKFACRLGTPEGTPGRDVVRQQLRELRPLRGPELRMMLVFVATALLWMTRSIPVGSEANYGWAFLMERFVNALSAAPGQFRAAYVHDATVALAMAILLFVIPAGTGKEGKREFLMDWETALKLPWGILLLFGGGFSIATGFQASGLSHWCGSLFVGLDVTDPFLLIAGVCLLMTLLTEVTSNTATTQVMLPILAKASAAMGFDPILLMLPATASASCAFMLPVATPPNAIVFGSGYVPMGRMVRIGIVLNLVGVGLVTCIVYLVARPLLGLS